MPKPPKTGKHQLPNIIMQTSSTVTPKSTSLGAIPKNKRSTDQLSETSSRSRTPPSRHSGNGKSPPSKRSHQLSASDYDSDQEQQMNITSSDHDEHQATSKAPLHSFLLTKFDTKFQTPKQLFQRLMKYVPREAIHQIIPTRNGIIIKSPDSALATTIRNKYSFEIFGKDAQLTPLSSRTIRMQPPPRRAPQLSVVIRGVDPDTTDEDVETELQAEGHTITKCLRIKTQEGRNSYMVRVLTTDQQTIDSLLQRGAYIYKRRYRVEPSRTQPPLPLRCERCQTYNEHSTAQCRNQPKCGYCSENHNTKACHNLANPPKCSQCNQQHPTFSYKCQGRPKPDPDNSRFVAAPLKVPEPTPSTSDTYIHPPPTIDQVISFITLTFQNLYPFQRESILHQVTVAAKEIFKVQLHATYSGPYVFFSVQPLNPE